MYYSKANIPSTHKNIPLVETESPHPRFEQYYYCKTCVNAGTNEKIYEIPFSKFGIERNGVVSILHNNRGKYFLHPNEIDHSFSRDILRRATEGLKQPNYMGVFSDKKIDEWLNYCEKYVKILQETEKAHQAKNALIFAEINEISKLGTVSKWRNIVEVQTKYFHIELQHEPQSAYMSKKITFTGKIEDVKNIENLSLLTFSA